MKEYNKGGSSRHFLNEEMEHLVDLHYHSKSETKGEDIMKIIIEQSGITRKEWRQWASR